jgi:putative peptidoglycan lipid II flippase
VLRKLGIVSGLTLVSRVFGLIRDVVMAAILGAGPVADTFMLAFRLPNHFRAIFAEGAFNAAFLPTYAALGAQGGDTRRLGAEVLGWLLLANLVILGAALGATGAVLALLAPGLSGADPTYPLAETLTRITFPYLLCMSVVAFLSAVLNSRDRFAAAAGAPVLLNLFMIGALLMADRFPTAAHAAAWGVLLSGGAQVALLFWDVRRAAIPLAPPRLGLSDETRTFFRRLGPAVLTSGALQVAILADTIIATFLPAGTLSHLYYADRLYQLPVGLIGVALGTVLLPDIGCRFGLGDEAGMRQALDRALRICLVVGLPVAILMALAGDLALEFLFVRGAFGPEDALAAAAILAAYSLGLVPALAVRSLVAGFNGRGDTRTPLKALVAATAVNIALKIVLAPDLGAAGLALATSAGITIYALLLYLIGRGRGYMAGPGWAYAGVLVGAAVVAAAGVFFLRPAIEPAVAALSPQLAALAALVAVTLWVGAVLAAGTALAARLAARGRTPDGP